MQMMIHVMYAHANGVALSPYEYWGWMFKLREIHYRAEYGQGGQRRAPAEFKPGG
jgi:hypothetical protein